MPANWEDLLWRPLHTVKATMDYQSDHPMDLCFEAGDIIDVLGIENDNWWNGCIVKGHNVKSKSFGSFPKIFVEIIEEPPQKPSKPKKITNPWFKDDLEKTLEQQSENSISKQKPIINSKPLVNPQPSVDKPPPPLPSREKLMMRQSSTKTIETVVPRNKSPIRQDLLNTNRPAIRRKNSSNSVSSEKSSKASTAFSIESETLVDEFEENPDPISRCLPIVDKDFEDYLDTSEYDFSTVDEYARETPESETKSEARLANYLTSVWDDDIYKLRAIFAWITDNITYDCDSFFSGKLSHKSAKDVLKTRTAVCAGYAELFYGLANEAGLRVWQISGNAKGAGFQAGDTIGPNDRAYAHAWNGALYKGEYLLIDSTWGAGHVNNNKFNKKFQPFYFLTSPTKFIYSHFPEQSSQQYLQPTITRKEFNNQPHYKSDFFNEGLRFLRFYGSVIEAIDDNIILNLEQSIDDGRINKVTAFLEWKGQRIDAFSQRLAIPGPNGGILHRLRIGCPTRGEGKLQLFYSKEGIKECPGICSILVKNSGTGAKYKQFAYQYTIPYSYTIIKPVYQTLGYGKRTHFEVILFNISSNKKIPEFVVYGPGMEMQTSLEIIDRNDSNRCITIARDIMLNFKGSWTLSVKKVQLMHFYKDLGVLHDGNSEDPVDGGLAYLMIVV
ncbi:14327_t:CDS:2 [Dentiscutata erythropus]|uniref:14327_t:CDS:1 n=1 Tax=Dentiscutata erythropus TaxID=1348616 RepID=A0A9N9ILR8_9GLOM|nr:14327_t:CDS:2 [Dentiscutata erythropus]